MNIYIIATICRESGALSIYNQLMNHIKDYVSDDNNFYIVIDPCMPKPNIKNVHYVETCTIGYRRFLFDFWGFERLCKKIGIIPDVVFSLNNTVPHYNNVREITYYHQPLTLYPYSFSPIKKGERNIFFFARFYYHYVKLTLKWTNIIITQTSIIKDKFSKRFSLPESQILTAFPDVEKVDVQSTRTFGYSPDTFNFVYPATIVKYKEHTTLAESLNLVRDDDVKQRIRIHLTLQKGEHAALEKLIDKYGLQQQFVYHGPMPHEQLLSMYKAADGLLFPSTIETIGLPLLEAAAFGLPVLANDMDYVKEVLRGYSGLETVPLRDYKAWGNAIIGLCQDKPHYGTYVRSESSDWPKIFQLILGNNENCDHKNG